MNQNFSLHNGLVFRLQTAEVFYANFSRIKPFFNDPIQVYLFFMHIMILRSPGLLYLIKFIKLKRIISFSFNF